MKNTILNEREIEQLRAETKGTGTVAHFNNAGSSLPPDVVVETVIDYLKKEAIYGGYETEYKFKEQLENTYALIARLINANKDEIAIVENASAAWGIAFNGIDFNAGDEIITSEFEYVTNVIGLLNAKKRYGIKIKVIPNDEYGNFCLTKLEESITSKTKLIAVTHIPSTAGGVLPVAEIGKIARKHNILYLLDACQSVGHIPVDVEEIGCDFLAVTGRKYLRAPRGTGFLYVREDVQDKLRPIFMDGFSVPIISQDDFKMRNDARRFELYEKNRGLVLGLGKAVEYALNIGLERIWLRIKQLATTMRIRLANIEEITMHDIDDELCGIVTFSVEGIGAQSVKTSLAENGINVSVGLAKSTLYYMNKHNLTSVVRASVHYYNNEEEITLLCDTLITIIAKTVIVA